MLLCTRHHYGDRASIRVWCRHRVSVPGQGNQVRTRCERLTTPGPTRRKKAQNPLVGVVCLLTTGDLIRVRRGGWCHRRMRLLLWSCEPFSDHAAYLYATAPVPQATSSTRSPGWMAASSMRREAKGPKAVGTAHRAEAVRRQLQAVVRRCAAAGSFGLQEQWGMTSRLVLHPNQ